jgi:hypothetical protein
MNPESTRMRKVYDLFNVLTQPLPEGTKEKSEYPKINGPLPGRDWSRQCASKPAALSLSSYLLLRIVIKLNCQTENEEPTREQQIVHKN